MLGLRYIFRWSRITPLLLAATMMAQAAPVNDPAIELLKSRLSSTSIGDRPRLCLQIAQKQLADADGLYAAADVEKHDDSQAYRHPAHSWS